MLVEEENEQQIDVIEEEETEAETFEEEVDEETESEEDETEEAETAEEDETETEDDEEETVITLEGETAPQEENDDKSAPQWVKDLRKDYREQAKENQELRAKLEALTKDETKPIELGPKPKLEDFDYDAEEFEKGLEDWHDKKRAYDEEQQNIKKQEEAQREAWNNKLEQYNEKKSKLKVKDFDDAEFVVTSTLNQTQQGMIVQGADDPAALVYALGKNPNKAKELASIEDPVKFAFAVAKLETKMKVSNRKTTPPPPEKKVRGTGNLSGTVDSTLDRLRKEAEKTGDYSKVTAYKRNKKK